MKRCVDVDECTTEVLGPVVTGFLGVQIRTAGPPALSVLQTGTACAYSTFYQRQLAIARNVLP
jgi:hypothetical protein